MPKDDYLANLPETEVAAWYNRLADFFGKNKIQGQTPLASIFLKEYLKNRNPKTTFRFSAPIYLQNLPKVTDTLKFHRKVFLTEEKARFTGGRRSWAGIVPRLQGKSPYQKWDLNKTKSMAMHYESLVEIGAGIMDIRRIQYRGTPAERDIFGSLRGFQLKSTVNVTASVLPDSKVKIVFNSWICEVNDKYDFASVEHLTVPNPDFKRHDLENAVEPDKETIRVYHTNAKRLVKAKMASPFLIKSYGWSVTNRMITQPAVVDPKKNLR